MGELDLYPFQKVAVDRMFCSEAFLLADEMGLGKTVSVLWEVRERYRTQGVHRVLVICPKSVIHSWSEHILLLFPQAVIRSTPSDFPADLCFVVTNYEQIRLALAEFTKVYWDYIICDEAHYIKNRKALRTKAVKRLRAKYRRALTGTPIVNRPDELWSILNWLYPNRFRSYWKFFESYVNYWQHPTMGYKKVLGPKNVEGLREEIHPFTVRRLKKTVLQELPDKYYTYLTLPMTGEQARAYEEMRRDSLAWVGTHEEDVVPAPVAVARLTRLRQFAASYAEVVDDHVRMTEPSNKLDALMDILEDTGEPVVVFSQFRQLIELAAARLAKAGISFVTFTGLTPHADREKHIREFQGGGVRVFLSTIRAGGVGVTLHRASTVVFLDRSWSPADNLQAEDRLHRIGQKSAVQVIILQSEGTVDKVVEDKLELKWSWIRQILEGGAG